MGTVKDPDAVLRLLTTKQTYWIFWHRTFDRSLPVEALILPAARRRAATPRVMQKALKLLPSDLAPTRGSIASTTCFSDAFLPSLWGQGMCNFEQTRPEIFFILASIGVSDWKLSGKLSATRESKMGILA